MLVCVSADIAETAYIRALQSAVIAHTVAKACRTGTLVSCGCSAFNTNTMAQVAGDSYSGNCSDNMEFGYQFALNFTTSGITSANVQAKTDLRNFNAGINVSIGLLFVTNFSLIWCIFFPPSTMPIAKATINH